jgi:siroheme synthase (precorrin-2 oxidase/ferrochelatase)
MLRAQVLVEHPRGRVALVGSGPTARRALHRLRAIGVRVHWYTDDLDIAEELLVASTPPGEIEVSMSDPLSTDYSEFVAVVAAAGTPLDEHIALRAGLKNIPAAVVDRSDLGTFEFFRAFDDGDHHHAVEDAPA